MLIRILGIRGIPASHGGFETFAEELSLFLVSHGWRVQVYCQVSESGSIYINFWRGVERILVPTRLSGSLGTILFDFYSIIHAVRDKSPCLVLGYNTAIFSILLRLMGVPVLMNMDGIEWKRAKWGLFARYWFWINEKMGCLLANHLIADHPEIRLHLSKNISFGKISVIPYGANEITDADVTVLKELNLVPYEYATLIARPEPENSIFEIVEGFSARERGIKLVILGEYHCDNNYHKKIKSVASAEVIFLGPIYDKRILSSLRFYSFVYLHGHQVGGTNPSLVEALGAGNAIIAHENKFNKWVIGDGALYFNTSTDIDNCFVSLQANVEIIDSLRSINIISFRKKFNLNKINQSYEDLIRKYIR